MSEGGVNGEGERKSEDLEGVLREHGYLDTGVEKFLGFSGAGRRAFRSTLWRTALLATILLLPAGLLLHLVVDPDLVREPARALRLVAFLAAGLFVIGGGLGCSLLLLTRDASRRGRRRGALALGILTTAGLVWAFLTARSAGSLRLSDLAVGVVLLGTAVALLWLLRLVAERSAGAQGGAGRGPVWALIVVLVALGLGIAMAFAPSRIEPRSSSAFSVVQTGQRIAWIQIDGLSPRRLDALLARGAGPLATWRDEGSGAETPAEIAALDIPSALDPPTAWTTAATGRGPAAHGIGAVSDARRRWGGRGLGRDLLHALWPPALPREEIPASSLLRRLPSVAEIVAAKDYRVLSLNAWCSGPSEADDGIDLVSDHALRRFVAEGVGVFEEEDVHPEALRRDMAALVAELGPKPLAERKAGLDAALVGVLERALSRSGDRTPDLVVLGLTSLDLVALDGDAEADARQEVALGASLARALAALAPTHAVVISSGPGYAEPSSAGAVFLRGGPFRSAPGVRLALVDLAPTILRVLGFPRADDAEGRVVERLLRADFLKRFAPRDIATHGDRCGGVMGDARLEAQHLDALRTLGYGGGRR